MVSIQPHLSGFDHIKRFVDKNRQIVIAKILPGELYVTKQNELIATVLGSCIAACIWDETLGIGGMNHFMLPVKKDQHGASGWQLDTSYTCRYGYWAMEFLINEILKNGGKKERLVAKVFGGGKIIPNMSDVGEKNIQFVRQYLRAEQIPVIAHDVGGPWPRKIMFHPNSGIAKMKRLRSMHNDTIQQREQTYMHDIELSETQSDIELF
ncbi:chemoreceptor glutamine deamidase CheD [Catenovulum sp. 2E275]|uniref:chemoreceptor glutamine deamidase CheD n=1 Tax=Catenovulum sp. 2E275 TaxID=2980497 RepID=UPI0021D1FD33|nr:chemoreceptor glutamine deamidase CheD [Catenovulum sp. 2E275]MCU4675512.1 chemoreceptor glutamine deamidase CheD [Catenovulum sp. 2E275]